MTENEAIKWQKSFKKTYNGFPPETEEACDMAIKALEEIRQYRAIGTIEQLKTMSDEFWKLNEMCKTYSAIGTIEEFRDLKEKSVPKKPIRKPNADMTHEEVTCPNCGSYCSAFKNKYCDCGQKLDWEGGE